MRYACLVMMLMGCVATPDKEVETDYRLETRHTLTLTASENAEAVSCIPGTDDVLLAASKSRRLRRLRVAGGALGEVRETTIAPEAAGDAELTHVAAAPDGTWAAATQTWIEVGEGGTQTNCGGTLWLIDIRDGDAFGAPLASLEVGPMPDNVAIASSGVRLAVANERDGPDAWGKCEVADLRGSVSLVDVSDPGTPVEVRRVEFEDSDAGPREPEALAFGSDSDLVAVTLQDSHELAFVRFSDGGAPLIVALPPGPTGAGPWPDGIAHVGGDVFAVAGEWNDTVTLVDAVGEVRAVLPLTTQTLPPGMPHVVDEGTPALSPDSLAVTSWGSRQWLVTTLRHAGAVMLIDVSAPADPFVVATVAVGALESGGRDADGSTVRPEGVAAAPDGRFVVVANEAESSVSLLVELGLTAWRGGSTLRRCVWRVSLFAVRSARAEP